MADQFPTLKNPPIVEAVVDIDCDLPPGLKIEALEKLGREAYHKEYPITETRYLLQHELQAKRNEPPKTSTSENVNAYLFLREDKKQLVQVRTDGFSFNRLAPYSTLDDYLDEVKRAWKLFVNLAKPVQVRAVRLRYINQIKVLLTDGLADLDDYLRIGPKLPHEETLILMGFLDQHMALEKDTSNFVQTTLTSKNQPPDTLVVIFDITVWKEERSQPDDWPKIVSTIQSLRNLKNRTFYNTLNPKCLQQYQ